MASERGWNWFRNANAWLKIKVVPIWLRFAAFSVLEASGFCAIRISLGTCADSSNSLKTRFQAFHILLIWMFQPPLEPTGSRLIAR